MNYNSSSFLSLNELIKQADKKFKKKNPKFRLMINLFVDKKKRIYGYFCYYYLRWVDDFVDSNSNSIEQKKMFFNRQLDLISAISSGQNVNLEFQEEYFILYFINYLISINKIHLIDAVLTMLNTIGMDIARLENDGIFSESEVIKYQEEQSKSLFRITYGFLLSSGDQEYEDYYDCLKTSIAVLFVREIKDDLDLGYINISREEILKFNLNLKCLLNDKNFKNWYRTKLSEINNMIDEKAELFRKLPFKLRLFWFGIYPYTLAKLARIKIYNYNPIEMKNKKLFKEMWIYLLLILNMIRYLYRIVLRL